MCISRILWAKPLGVLTTNFFVVIDIGDIIMYFKFGDDRFRGLALAEGQILPFPIDFDGRPYNTLTLSCERVITALHSLRCSYRSLGYLSAIAGICC